MQRTATILFIASFMGLTGCGSSEPAYDAGMDSVADTISDQAADADAPWDPASDSIIDFPPEPPADFEEEACVGQEVQARNAIAPVDIIWVVDSSGSMDFENAAVQNNLNAFSASISASGIDHHVILIGDADQMTVPPPLGGSPYFMHIDDKVDSNEGLEKLVEHYPDYRTFLRPGAVRHFVAVTDDESDMSSDEFILAVNGFTDPGFPDGYTFHSIVAFGSVPIIGCITGAAVGWQYLTLSDLTGGVKQQVCLTDWSPIFAALETAIAVVTELPCVFDIPPPPEGEELDPNKVNVIYTATDGTETVIPKVGDPGACGAFGWYYNDETMPTQIYVCPDTCATLQADTGGRVNISFGCTTIII
jgi:hypothetical protein